MRTARHIALAAAVAAMTGCGLFGSAPCDVEIGPKLVNLPVDSVAGGKPPYRLRREMPDLAMVVGETVKTPLADHYGRTECLMLYVEDGLIHEMLESTSSDPAAVAVTISGADVVTKALAVADSVRVTVAMNYGEEEDHYPHEFLVTVRPPE